MKLDQVAIILLALGLASTGCSRGPRGPVSAANLTSAETEAETPPSDAGEVRVGKVQRTQSADPVPALDAPKDETPRRGRHETGARGFGWK